MSASNPEPSLQRGALATLAEQLAAHYAERIRAGGYGLGGILTPTGLKDWTDAQIAKAIRDGVDRNGQPYRPPMAYEFYKNINDADMAAIIAYLRSLQPQPTAGTS